jgi:NAD(P)-dependent dehydrogenase (short-subunit alcohol dehydrogenase family)
MFTGKVAIVTGAAAGIGEVTAKLLAAQGLSVVVADVLDDAGEQTAADIRMKGGSAAFLHVDVSVRADVERMVPFAVSEFGGLDYAVNNAGVGHRPAKLHEIDEAEWDRVIGIDLKGVWYCLKAEITHMIANGGGAIVNTASVAGLIGLRTSSAYVAAKHGVIGLTKTAAVEYAEEGIRVNAVCPGYIVTRMTGPVRETRSEAVIARTPMRRFGEPREIAEMVVWLCSERASYITGAAYQVDGGLMAS